KVAVLFQRSADYAANVIVEYQDHRPAVGDGLWNSAHQPVQESLDPLERRVALPLEDQRHIALAFLEIEAREVVLNRTGNGCGVDCCRKIGVGPQNLQVP